MKAYKKITIILLLQLLCFQQNIIAQDTLSVSKPEKHTFKAEPFRATMLATALPGLGQIYNRKYWKVPFVYAGFGGLVYAVSFNTKEYNRFMKGYQDLTDKSAETVSYIEIIKNTDPASYDPVLHPGAYAYYKERMLRQVDYFKRYRDLSYIGIAAWYLFTILDANVDASLFNYDVKDNLEIKVAPALVPIAGQQSPVVNMCLRVTF